MRRRLTPSQPARAGFTLTELVVVIGIMAILMSLVTAAVVRVRYEGPKIQNRHDIQSLSTAIDSFKADFGVDFIPSRILLREDMLYSGDAFEMASLSYLKKLWPRLATPTTPGFTGHDWNGDGAIGGAFYLEGDQCLVFFLGGIPSPPSDPNATRGFTTNREYPANWVTNPNSSPKGPYFDFKSERLVRGFNPTATRSEYFFSYRDNWGANSMPYAYFSGRSFTNPSARGYNNDCPGLASPTLGVFLPYHNGAAKPIYYNRDGFQIICAGRDMEFGPGGAYDPRQGWETGPTADDMSNFHPKLLGDAIQ